MAKFEKFFDETKSKKELLSDEDFLCQSFIDRLGKELDMVFDKDLDAGNLEKSLLKEWEKYPSYKDQDPFINEPLNLEKLKMALAVWKSLPSEPLERSLILDKIGELSQNDISDKYYLSVQCYKKYHLKNLLLLERHWSDCFSKNETYVPIMYWSHGNVTKWQEQKELVQLLDDACLYLDLPLAVDVPDGKKRFAIFRQACVENGLMNDKNADLIKVFLRMSGKIIKNKNKLILCLL